MSEAPNEIARLNDQLRCYGIGGRVVATQGVLALSQSMRAQLMEAISRFADFTEGNDPHDEHDFGAVEIAGERYFWKIDYYDLDYEGLSPDPLDQSVTRRVLTVMRADEY